MSELWLRRNYTVNVGMPAMGKRTGIVHPNTMEVEIDGERLLVIPFKDFHPITLSYPPERAKKYAPYSEFAVNEARERAVKVWKKEHPEDEDVEIVAWGPVFLRESPIENTLGAT